MHPHRACAVLHEVCILFLGLASTRHPHLRAQRESEATSRHAPIPDVHEQSPTLCWLPQGPASMNSQMGQPGVETSEVGASPAAVASFAGCGAIGAEVAGVFDILTDLNRVGNGGVS